MSRADLSSLPSMTALLEAAAKRETLAATPRPLLVDALRAALDDARRGLLDGQPNDDAFSGARVASILDRAATMLEAGDAVRLRRVINATGIVLHTGLGRSVLAEAAAQRVAECASGYCNLEIDLSSGQRGRRGRYAERLLCQLTGAEGALVVNNNAGATMLVLHGLARGREVIVSRGQLIEIGGSYRLPDVMEAGGAVLREVGTTNKTHLSDYEAAIGPATALLMHVHTSNYRVVGFSQTPGTAELAALAQRHGLPFFDDLGSGALLDDPTWVEAGEPTATASLRAGADVAAFSGDKLLGGPQAGILLGRRGVIEALRASAMARALRVGKLTLAALEATLELYLSPDSVRDAVPTLAALAEPTEVILGRAQSLAAALAAELPAERFEVGQEEAFAGGGAMPVRPLATAAVSWRPSCDGDVDAIARRLRTGEPAVLARIHDDRLLFDLRTIRPVEIDALVQAVAAAVPSA